MRTIPILFAAFLIIGGSKSGVAAELNSKIHVIFLASFDDETVELDAAERKIFVLNLHTEPTAGTAGSAEVDLNKSSIRLKVSVPRLKATKVIRFSPSGGAFLYVSLTHNQLSFQQTKLPLALD